MTLDASGKPQYANRVTTKTAIAPPRKGGRVIKEFGGHTTSSSSSSSVSRSVDAPLGIRSLPQIAAQAEFSRQLPSIQPIKTDLTLFRPSAIESSLPEHKENVEKLQKRLAEMEKENSSLKESLLLSEQAVGNYRAFIGKSISISCFIKSVSSYLIGNVFLSFIHLFIYSSIHSSPLILSPITPITYVTPTTYLLQQLQPKSKLLSLQRRVRLTYQVLKSQKFQTQNFS